ncbi:hypothetical protein TCON_2753 [Astathelohania contejeani]|uniref:Uncharacterized protein n=1 Tax=Astathelohania contejeani TaxID=164912 RepID=A0ABQ7HV48_9MICR|nr:hypothetical protein TCON_2753 [Thelohania contejeani]
MYFALLHVLSVICSNYCEKIIGVAELQKCNKEYFYDNIAKNISKNNQIIRNDDAFISRRNFLYNIGYGYLGEAFNSNIQVYLAAIAHKCTTLLSITITNIYFHSQEDIKGIPILIDKKSDKSIDLWDVSDRVNMNNKREILIFLKEDLYCEREYILEFDCNDSHHIEFILNDKTNKGIACYYKRMVVLKE